MATLGAARGGDGDSGHARVPRQAAGCLQRVRHIPHVATAVIGFSFFSDYILLLMMVPILPLYGTELGLSKTAIGFMFGVKPFAQMFANPIMGTVCDRVGTRAPMVAALVCLSAATMLFAFAETYALLVVARILQGVASSANVVAGMAHLSKLFSGKYSDQRGAQIGRAALGISIGVMAGAPLGGILFAIGGKRLPFLVVAGVLVVDAIARVVLLAEPDEVHAALRTGVDPESDGVELTASSPPHDAPSGSSAQRPASPSGSDGRDEGMVVIHLTDNSGDAGSGGVANNDTGDGSTPLSAMGMLKRLVTDGQVMAITMVLLLGNGGIGFIEAQFPLYLSSTFDLGSTAIGIIYGAQTMLFSMVMPVLAARGDKIGRPLLMGVGLILMGSFIPAISLVKDLVWVMPNWMGTAVGMACVDSSCNPQLADIVERRHPGCYGKAFALANTGTSLGFTLAPIVGGYIADTSGFGLAAFVIGVLLLFYSPVVWSVFKAWPCGCFGRGRPHGMTRLEEEVDDGVDTRRAAGTAGKLGVDATGSDVMATPHANDTLLPDTQSGPPASQSFAIGSDSSDSGEIRL